MALPTKTLDDRTFQDIVDEAKKRIAASCPAWTDHNVSDPGVTLVELFAWMTEMILYRLNQVPEKHYIKLMELIGLTLREPEPARTPVTFYLSAPQPLSVVIPRGTEVATVRTETRPAVVFSTDADLEIRPPVLAAVQTREAPRSAGGKRATREHNLRQMGVGGYEFAAFGGPPMAGDALYLNFTSDLSDHVLGVDVVCPVATGMGIDPDNPPWQWEVYAGSEGGDSRWTPAVVESDGTGGFNQTGLVLVRLPRMALRDEGGQRWFQLRCRVIEPEEKGRNYDRSPRLNRVSVSSWGGMAWANHASVVKAELLGRSDGTPGQVFRAEYRPLLRRTDDEAVEILPPGAETWEAWREVPDFADSGPDDRHFACDSTTGEVRFGPALRQPDGSVCAYGAIPPRGAQIRFGAYRHGGGVVGNVQAGTLTVLKTSIPYVDRVINHLDATGGLDAETVDLAQVRAPSLLRSRGRAVTATDFEALAPQADSRVVRARCVQPRASGSKELAGGQVFLLLVPRVNQPEGRLTPEQLRLPDDLRESVAKYLDDYRLLTVRLDIREPEYLRVAAEVAVTAEPEADPQRVRADVERELYRFLNPLAGGPDGDGWPFGRALYPSDVYACLQRVRGIAFIESLKLSLVRPGGEPDEIDGRLPVPVHGLVASGEHRVRVARMK